MALMRKNLSVRQRKTGKMVTMDSCIADVVLN